MRTFSKETPFQTSFDYISLDHTLLREPLITVTTQQTQPHAQFLEDMHLFLLSDVFRLLSPPPPHPTLIFNSFHVPCLHFIHVLHLRHAHGLRHIRVIRETPDFMYCIAQTCDEAGAEHDQQDDDGWRDLVAEIVVLALEDDGEGGHCDGVMMEVGVVRRRPIVLLRR